MSTANKKFYTDVQIKSDIIIDNATAGNVPVFDGSKKIKSSTVTGTELGQLSGITSNVQTQLDAKIDATEKGAINGVATLDAGGKVPVSQLPNSVMEYKGAWDASTNSPTLADGTGNAGDVYRASVAGSQTFGGTTYSFGVGDFIIYSGSVWEKAPASDAVLSVFGRQGVITAQSGDYNTSQVTESGNLYFTDERAQDAVGSILTDSNTVDFTYNDAGNTITADVKTQLSITSDSSGIKLVNDSSTPGNTKYYGTNSSGVKGFYDIPAVGSAGDIQETSFSLTNNQSTVANITGLAFANGVVRSFKAIVSIYIDASSDLFEVFELNGIQRGSDWVMSIESEGDDSGLTFSITNAGQIQYTSTNVAGFVSGVANFRATTTSV